MVSVLVRRSAYFLAAFLMLFCFAQRTLALSNSDIQSIISDTTFYDPDSGCGDLPQAGSGQPSADLNAFVDKYGQMAYDSALATGVPYEFTLGQAYIESGRGQSELTTRYFNFFGIKADSSWHGPTVMMWTTEDDKNGNPYQVLAAFRVYSNAKASFDDHAKFLIENSRYAPAFQYSHDPLKFLMAIWKAGYATSTTYYQTVAPIIEQVMSYVASKNLWPPSSQIVYKVTPGSPADVSSVSTDSCSCGGTSSGASALSSAGVPNAYANIFANAAAKYGIEPTFLAAVFYGGVQNNKWPTPPQPYGTGPAWSNPKGPGQGPFAISPENWKTYGVDGSGDGKTDVNDLTDAAFGAANYLGTGLNAANTTDEQALRKAAAGFDGSKQANGAFANSVWAAYQKFISTNSQTGCGGGGTTAAGVYRNPFRKVVGLRPERVDQGVDYGGQGPVYALGTGTIVNLTNSGWEFGGYDGFVTEELSDGPAAHKFVYVAEDCRPRVSIGQSVTSDTVICDITNPSGSGIETGWASPPGNGKPLAQDYGGWGGNNPTTVGLNYDALLISLGAPAGLIEGSTIGTPLPPDWPKW